MREAQFQAKLIKDLRREFPGCVILKNDTDYLQGIPDLTILYGPRWAMLEDKRSDSSSRRENQEYYIDYLNEMSYAAFIHPDNKTEILDDLQHALRADGDSRFS